MKINLFIYNNTKKVRIVSEKIKVKRDLVDKGAKNEKNE